MIYSCYLDNYVVYKVSGKIWTYIEKGILWYVFSPQLLTLIGYIVQYCQMYNLSNLSSSVGTHTIIYSYETDLNILLQ